MLTVCEWFGLKTTRTFFVGLVSKPVATISSGLASKHAAMIFSGLTSKPVVTVFSSLTSKLVVTVSPGLASKPAVDFLVEPQNEGGGGFPGLGLKIGSFSLVICASKSPRRFLGLVLKNQVGFGLSVAPQNRQREVGAGHTSRFSGLLYVEASLA
jgi:hypothetical protein